MFNGDEVFTASLHPVMRRLWISVHESGTFHFTWLDNFGLEYTNSAEITVI